MTTRQLEQYFIDTAYVRTGGSPEELKCAKYIKEQCKKLFEDIVQAAKRNQLHFTGSIVYQPLAPIKGINNNIIIVSEVNIFYMV